MLMKGEVMLSSLLWETWEAVTNVIQELGECIRYFNIYLLIQQLLQCWLTLRIQTSYKYLMYTSIFFRPFYAVSASPEPKDLVIVLDMSMASHKKNTVGKEKHAL